MESCLPRQDLPQFFEAEIRATDEGLKPTMPPWCNLADGSPLAVTPLAANSTSTMVYNDNKAYVNWANSVSMENIHHTGLRDNTVCEWVQDKSLQVSHVDSKATPVSF